MTSRVICGQLGSSCISCEFNVSVLLGEQMSKRSFIRKSFKDNFVLIISVYIFTKHWQLVIKMIIVLFFKL